MKRQIIAVFILLMAAGCASRPYEGPMVPAKLPLPPQKPTTSSTAGTQYAALPGRFALPETNAQRGMIVSEEERFCLAQAIYFEAGMRNPVEQRAVGDVVLNRVRNSRFPDTICDVVYQGGDKGRNRCQFSWWCDGRSDEPVEDVRWAPALQSADEVLSGEYADRTNGALFFHNRSVKPAWSRRLHKTAALGPHIFYR